MHSRLYEGVIRHRRLTPIAHRFHYRLYWAYLDLGELDEVFRGRWFWSTRRTSPCRFRQEDHLGDPTEPLDDSVRQLVERKIGLRPEGPIRLLTQLRHFGFVMNPISLYFCFDAGGNEVEAVVAEVHNTPWGERHCYVLDTRSTESGRRGSILAQKEFHVSPFMGIDQQYVFRLHKPGHRLVAHIENHEAGRKRFDATLVLRERPVTTWNLTRVALRYPLASLQIAAGIYWQALRLWMKGAPYHPHPATLENSKVTVS